MIIRTIACTLMLTFAGAYACHGQDQESVERAMRAAVPDDAECTRRPMLIQCESRSGDGIYTLLLTGMGDDCSPEFLANMSSKYMKRHLFRSKMINFFVDLLKIPRDEVESCISRSDRGVMTRDKKWKLFCRDSAQLSIAVCPHLDD